MLPKRAAGGGIAVLQIKLNGLPRAIRNILYEVCAPELALRYQKSAYVSMRRGGRSSPSRVAPQKCLLASVPAEMWARSFLFT